MYKLTKENVCVIREDGACIPFADGNTDYEQYKQWLSEGNTPEPYVPTPAELNAPIYAQLDALDKKLIRPLSEGETDRVAEIVAQKAALRAQLV